MDRNKNIGINNVNGVDKAIARNTSTCVSVTAFDVARRNEEDSNAFCLAFSAPPSAKTAPTPITNKAAMEKDKSNVDNSSAPPDSDAEIQMPRPAKANVNANALAANFVLSLWKYFR